MSYRVRGGLTVLDETNTERVNESLLSVSTSSTSGESVLGAKIIEATGSATLTRILPAANTGGVVKAGIEFTYINNSSANLTINNSAGTQVGIVPSGRRAIVTLLTTATAAGTWEFSVIDNPTGTVTPDVLSFDATTSWGSPTAGMYTIRRMAADHMKGTTPIVTIEELIGGNFVGIGESYELDSSGNVSIMSRETPDGRYAGRISIL